MPFFFPKRQEHGKSKLNKSFAEEKNVTFCPPLELARVFCFGGGGVFAPAPGSLTVTRSDDHGGTVTYDSFEKLRADYQSGALHPGDLKKGAMVAVMVGLLEKLSAAIKGDKAVKQAAACLKAQSKKKK